MRKFCLLLLLMIAPLICQASGYTLSDISAAAAGMADAYICRVDDPSAVWYNPAALTRLDGNQVTIDASISNTSSDFHSQITDAIVHSGTIHSVPSNFFYSHQLSEDTHFGFGVYRPFGVHTQWPLDSGAAFVSSDFNLRVFYVTPSFGFKLTPNVSIGAGLDFVFSDFEWDKNQSLQPASQTIIAQQVSVRGSDFGFNIGTLVQTDDFQLAITYKTRVDTNYDGSVVFLNVPPAFRPTYPDGGANITLTLPSQISFGAATHFQNLSFEGDMIYTRWRDFEALRLNFDRNTPPDINLRRGFLSTWTLRFGADYTWRKNYIFRAGAFHDPTPVPEKALDPILPDSSRNGFSAGLGYQQGNWSLNVAYTAEFFSDRVSPLNNFASPLAAGTYSNHAHLLSFGFGYKFTK